jgi:hypothetical protein
LHFAVTSELIETGNAFHSSPLGEDTMTIRLAFRLGSGLLAAAIALLAQTHLEAADAKKINDKVREIAGSAEFLRSVPKKFAALKAVDPAKNRVTLLMEGESAPKEWPLTHDAEIKISGWWGRLEQFTLGDRVWAWLKTNRAGQPVAVFMLADELSEQDMHGPGVLVEAAGPGSLTFKPAKGKSRRLKLDKTAPPAPGARVYLQSAASSARLLLDSAGFEARRAAQKDSLRQRWLDKGLPGTVTFLHLSGEMDFMLDHETMRWARSLKPGDKVSLFLEKPIPALVKNMKPWRERTQLRLVAKGADLADLAVGQRMGLRMTPPAAEVEKSPIPPDAGRLTDKKERVEWFLASIYCTCPVAGDGCTGDFYTLSSCNPNACGMPNRMRKLIAEKIDKSLTDKQIFEELLKERGPELIRPHLVP